ncbi:MAG: DHA2 family efflux MFS transporter permease subunit [Ktedonobacteraceae bacterium]
MFHNSFLNIRLSYKWIVTLAITLGMFMSLMDSTIVIVAIPQMQRIFGADIHDVQWVVTVYMLTQAAVIPATPFLAAKFGGKRTYVWTLSAFVLGSLLCGFAWNLPTLILFRLIQGIGGGILLPMVMTLLYQTFPPEERGTAASVMGVPLMVAPMLGPVLGGYLVGMFGWPWAFFINVPLGIVAVIIAQKFLQTTPAEQQVHLDGAGFLTAAAGSALLLYGISAVTSGNGTPVNILLLIGGVALLLTFVVVELLQRRLGREPLLDFQRFRDQTFTFSVLAQVFFMFVRFGILFLIPIYLQTLHQESVLRAGVIQAAQALAVMVILPIGGRVADKVGPRSVALVGLIVFVGAAALLVTLTLTTAIWMIVGMLILLGCASGLAQQIPVAAMSGIKKEESKEVTNGSTLLSVLQATAAPMGVAVFSSIVQIRGQHYVIGLAAQDVKGKLLQLQSSLLAMREIFSIAALLALLAFVAMCFVPKTRKSKRAQEVERGSARTSFT